MKKIFNRKQHWTRVLVVFALVCTLPVYAYDYTCDKGIITGTKSSTGISYTLGVTISDLGAGSCTFDTTAGVTGGAPAGINISVSSSSASGTIEYGNDALPTSNFTISMNGKLIPPSGGSGGTQPTWGASGQAKAPYNIKSNYDNGAKVITVPAGTSITYTAYEGTSSKSSNWTVNGVPKNNESSIIFSRSWWDVSGWFSAGMGTPDPGVYIITASPTDYASSDGGQMTVVGIEKLQENSTGTFADVSSTVFMEKDKPLEVKALPFPEGTWPENKPTWNSSGSWLFSDHILGDNEGVDVVSIDTSGEDDSFTVTATCGVSNKSVDIKTFNYKFAIYVDDPTYGDIPISITYLFSPDVGHAWWKLYTTNNVTASNVNLSDYSNYMNTPVGYYPQDEEQIVAANDFSGPGCLNLNDTLHSASKTKIQNISRASFINALNYTRDRANENSTYVVAIRVAVTETPDENQLPVGVYCETKTERNCVTIAAGAASAANVSIPDSYQDYSGEWYLGYLKASFEGHCPSRLAENL